MDEKSNKKDEKLSVGGEPKFSDIGKWFDNFWYHYKFRTVVAAVAIVTLIICVTQLFNRESVDYHMMYAGPKMIMLQEVTYMEEAVEALADDRDGNGKIAVTFADVTMLSPEELEAASRDGAAFDAGFINNSRKEYEQHILSGDVMICFLSPYMYESVHESGGFLPLSKIFEKAPDTAYDDCGIILSETEFGQYFNGMNDLPDDTILCIRRLPTTSVFTGKDKTEREHRANVELFRKIVEFKAPVDSEGVN